MLVTGYFGEAVDSDNAQIWGFFLGLAYFVIVYDIWLGSAKKLATEVEVVLSAQANFMLVGPCRMGNLSTRLHGGHWRRSMVFFLDGVMSMDVIYNIGDAINKIGFGLVVYNLAVQSSKD